MHLHHLPMVVERLGRYAVLSDDPADVREIARRLGDPEPVGSHREYELWRGTLGGQVVTVMSTGIGSPSLAIGMEELHRAGVDTTLAVGRAVPVAAADGEPVACLAHAAIREDGTGTQYLPLEFPAVADHGLLREVLRTARPTGIPMAIGLVRSTDALYGPTLRGDAVREQERREEPGVICADLSTAAHYTLASALGMRSVALLATAAPGDPVPPEYYDLVVAAACAIMAADAGEVR